MSGKHEENRDKIMTALYYLGRVEVDASNQLEATCALQAFQRLTELHAKNDKRDD